MTLGELTKAIQQHIDLEMDSEVAQGMAEHALGFFGFTTALSTTHWSQPIEICFTCSKIIIC